MRRPPSGAGGRGAATAFVSLLAVFTLGVTPPVAMGADPVWGPIQHVGTYGMERFAGRGALARTHTSTTTYLHAVTTHDGGQGESNGGIHYTRSRSDGASWDAEARLNGAAQVGTGAVVAASGSNVYVAWLRTVPGASGRTVYVRRNTGNGRPSAWRDRVRLTSTSRSMGYPSIAATGSSLYVAWTNRSTRAVRVAVSRDRGATWQRVTLATSTRREAQPVVAASGSTVAVCWVTGSPAAVRCRISTSTAGSFGHSKQVGYGTAPSVAALGSRVGVAASPSAGEPWVRTWSGGTWHPATATSHPVAWGPGWPVIALRGTTQVGLAFVSEVPSVLPEYETELRVGWSESADDGGTWTPEQLVSDGTPGDGGPSVVWRSTGDLYLMWRHWYFDDGGCVQLRMRR